MKFQLHDYGSLVLTLTPYMRHYSTTQNRATSRPASLLHRPNLHLGMAIVDV